MSSHTPPGPSPAPAGTHQSTWQLSITIRVTGSESSVRHALTRHASETTDGATDPTVLMGVWGADGPSKSLERIIEHLQIDAQLRRVLAPLVVESQIDPVRLQTDT